MDLMSLLPYKLSRVIDIATGLHLPIPTAGRCDRVIFETIRLLLI